MYSAKMLREYSVLNIKEKAATLKLVPVYLLLSPYRNGRKTLAPDLVGGEGFTPE